MLSSGIKFNFIVNYLVNPKINSVEQTISNSIKINWNVDNKQVFNLTKYILRFAPDFVEDIGWPG